MIAFAGIAFGVGATLFYRGGYEPPSTERVSVSEIVRPVAPETRPWEPPVARPGGGKLLVDALHRNNFVPNEIVSLRTKVADLGYEVELLGDFSNTGENERLPILEEQLRDADSLMVISPRVAYSDDEVRLVENFVDKGGKLLLISEPARPNNSNSLAKHFGVNFQPDYLYNQIDNDANFQNIFVSDFQPEEITAGIGTVALYTAGSIRSSGPALAFTGENTTSSLLASSDSFSPMAWGDSRNVLAIADFTFIIPPNDVSLDNDRLLSNIADYLTVSNRAFDLGDFPHFLGNGAGDDVDILLGQPALLASGTTLKGKLGEQGVVANVSGVEDLSKDTVFLGLYEDAFLVDIYLQSAGIRIDDTLGGAFGSDVELEGTAVTVLDSSQQRDVLVVLADTPEVLSEAVERLFNGEFRNELVSDFAGVSISP